MTPPLDPEKKERLLRAPTTEADSTADLRDDEMGGSIPEWMRGQGGTFISVSFRNQIRRLRSSASAARKAYKGDYNAPCQYLADSYEEAAFLLEKRLQRITGATR